jgi:hypothetical protein
MAENFPRMWWVNQIVGAGYTLGGGLTESAGFEWANTCDWRDFSEFQWVATTGSFAELLPAVTPYLISGFFIWLSRTPVASTFVLSAELTTSGAGFTTIATIVVPAGTTAPVGAALTAPKVIPAGCKFRITRTDATGQAVVFRQIFVGSSLDGQRGQFGGIAPPTLSGTIVTNTTIAVNGSILGRNIRRTDRGYKIDLSPVTPEWVRGAWEPFAAHMARFACFFQWNSVDYPNEIVFGGAEQIVPPENSNPPPYMAVSMPLRVLL